MVIGHDSLAMSGPPVKSTWEAFDKKLRDFGWRITRDPSYLHRLVRYKRAEMTELERNRSVGSPSLPAIADSVVRYEHAVQHILPWLTAADERDFVSMFGRASKQRAAAKAEAVLSKLVVQIHASSVETVLKLYKPGGPEIGVAQRVAEDLAVATMRESEAFQQHHRCEANPEYDAGELSALQVACGRSRAARLRIGLSKSLFFPRDGMLQQFEENYGKVTRRCVHSSHNSLGEIPVFNIARRL